MGMKTFGLATMLREAFQPLDKQVSAMFVYGSIAKHPDLAYDVADIMIVAEGLSPTEVMPHLIEAQRRVGCKIIPSIYNVRELRRKLACGDTFLTTVMNQPKIFLIGSDDDIPRPPGMERLKIAPATSAPLRVISRTSTATTRSLKRSIKSRRKRG